MQALLSNSLQQPLPSTGLQEPVLWDLLLSSAAACHSPLQVSEPSSGLHISSRCRSMYQKFKTAAEEKLKLEELGTEATPPPDKEMSPADADEEPKLDDSKAEVTPSPEMEMSPADADEEPKLEDSKAGATPPPEKEMSPADAKGSAQ